MADKRDIVVGVIIIGSIVVFGLLVVFAIIGSLGEGDIEFTGLGDKIGIVEVQGAIYNSRDIVRQLNKYEKSDNIPAVVLDINSPGGAVVPSLEIYEEILKVREKGLIVVANFGSVAASGGYLIACACDTIVSSPGTITGSIGTILSYPVADELLDKIGLRYEIIKSGEYKDVGNFARETTERERRMLQNLIDDSHEKFIELIADGRGMDVETVRDAAHGQIFSGERAKILGLVDVLGDYYDAVEIAADMAGIEEDPTTVKERKHTRSFWDTIAETSAAIQAILENQQARTGPQLEYILR
ncbi:MAG: signal peptide peptidase SppA [candidate division Zixibacteria bacterium]|nr:signal peptide peptidase SppA [candidate division Zixibacteria bacterium]